MRKRAVSLALLGILFAGGVAAPVFQPSTIEAQATSTTIGYVKTTSLNVRSTSSTSGSILGKLASGAKVAIVQKESNGWYKIKYESSYGYVSGDYISTTTNSTRQSILSKAEDMVNFSWKSTKSFDTWNGSSVNGSTQFKANTTYTGMPYTQRNPQMKNSTEFKNTIAAETGSLSTTVSGKKAPKYGMDCSGFVSAAWGIDRKTTSTLPNVSTKISYNDLQPGDILNKAGSHVVIFGGWADTAKTKMVILEETPPKAKKSVALRSKYENGGYLARRWNKL